MEAGIEARFAFRHPGFALDLDLALPGRGITALFGPSGSGKSSTLRALAGLQRGAGGYLRVNGEVWQDDRRRLFVPPHRRRLGYVFQEASLFPHLSVRGNLEYGWRRSGAAADAFDGFVRLLDLAPLLGRMPAHLSGGECQRVAIARALLTQPRLLLLDEPLSALDPARKAEILPYLERLRDGLEIPAVYVSHSMEEVARLADHLVLFGMDGVRASGPLREMLARLEHAGAFADDVGVVIEATVAAHEAADCLTRLDFAGGSIFVTRRPEALGRRLRCRIHARDVALALSAPVDTSVLNQIRGVVTDMADTDNPAQVLVRLDAAGTPLLARITRRSQALLGLRPGMQVWALVKAAALLG
jgi:molybdate transport system ATP-binding protein